MNYEVIITPALTADYGKVFSALSSAGIEYDTEYAENQRIMVDVGDVSAAAAALNGIGYATDEDVE